MLRFGCQRIPNQQGCSVHAHTLSFHGVFAGVSPQTKEEYLIGISSPPNAAGVSYLLSPDFGQLANLLPDLIPALCDDILQAPVPGRK